MQLSPSKRLASIDVFRALTMLFMIFVNDLWTLHDVPRWLEHAEAGEDRLGFADTIFPAFLFIVGLSIPFAIGGRIQRGEKSLLIVKHILFRAAALVIMGVFHVNLESYNSSAALLQQPVWEILITVGFFLIWLDYSAGMNTTRRYAFQTAGILILIVMALLYKGGDPGEAGWMRFHWWGILGLIGWAYLVCGVLFVLFKDNLLAHSAAFIFFLVFLSLETVGALEFLAPIKRYVWIIGDGSMPALVSAGILVSLGYNRLTKDAAGHGIWTFLVMFAALNLIFGYATRPLWGIHKISASPSWVAVCIGFSTLVFTFLVWLVDKKKREDLFIWIRPGGTSTLTAYLLPYIHYPLAALAGITLPLVFRTGGVGIAKSFLYALAIILFTGFLERKKIRLKL